jgi:hypothetical protein
MTYIEKMTGYKATDANMQCRGYQFEIGRWFECDEGEIIKCGSNGFHFCPQPSGPWAYYSEPDARLWKIEAEQVLESPDEPGTDNKKVCRRIRFVEEIIPDGDGNTGYGNTGYGNTGDRNTGDGNTGYGNATDYSSGFFCQEEPTVVCFDVDTGMKRGDFLGAFPKYRDLLDALLRDDAINFFSFSDLPGITPEKLASLHAKHIEGRKAKQLPCYLTTYSLSTPANV